MQFQLSKKTLQQQVRPPIREKKLKNQDRLLYVKGLFNPPPTETSESVMGTKVLDQWRNVLSLGVLTAFLMLMMMVSIIGDYGILSSYQLQERKEILEQNIKDLKNKEVDARAEYLTEPHPKISWWLELCRHLRGLDAVESVLGANLILIMSHLIVKHASDGLSVVWHQDNTYWHGVKGSDITCLLYTSPSPRD